VLEPQGTIEWPGPVTALSLSLLAPGGEASAIFSIACSVAACRVLLFTTQVGQPPTGPDLAHNAECSCQPVIRVSLADTLKNEK
jgi:hypothetical protein